MNRITHAIQKTTRGTSRSPTAAAWPVDALSSSMNSGHLPGGEPPPRRGVFVPLFGLPIGEDRFYVLLGEAADNIVAAGDLLVETMDDFEHLEQRAERM